MRVWRILSVVAVGLLLAFVAIAAWGYWVHSHLYYPSDENRSAFLRTYQLKPAIQPFMAPGENSGEGGGSGGSAGEKFVTENQDFSEYFVIRTAQKELLMAAVSDDLARHLLQSGALIRRKSGTASTGFHFDYALPNAIGSISIQPLAADKVQRNIPLCPGLEDVSLSMEITEEWFPNGVPEGTVAVARQSD